MGRLRRPLLAALSLAVAVPAGLLAAAEPSEAGIKVYDASIPNGLPGELIRAGPSYCPPVLTFEDRLGGSSRLLDDGLGTVTLEAIEVVQDFAIVLGPDLVAPLFGPGSFIFIDDRITASMTTPHTSLAGAPASTAAGGAVQWGIVSGWQITGFQICESSPVSICNDAGFVHVATVRPVLPSTSYDLGTWTFDARADYAGAPYLWRTSNGGLANDAHVLRGRFVGESLPALPVVGLGLLAAALALVGGRGLRASRR